MNPLEGTREDVKDSWVSVEFCYSCDLDVEHLFLQFVDESVVEAECQGCRVLTVHTDGRE